MILQRAESSKKRKIPWSHACQVRFLFFALAAATLLRLYKQREIKEKMLQQFMIGFESNYANSHSSMKHFSLASSQLAQLSMAMSWVSKVWAPHLIIEANNKMLLNLL